MPTHWEGAETVADFELPCRSVVLTTTVFGKGSVDVMSEGIYLDERSWKFGRDSGSRPARLDPQPPFTFVDGDGFDRA